MPQLQDPVERSRTLGMTSPVRNEVVAALAEFCGTFMFLFMAFAATQGILTVEDGLRPTAAQVLFVAASFGGSLAAMVWAFYRISGGMFNPAVRLSVSIPSLPLCSWTFRRLVLVLCADTNDACRLPSPSPSSGPSHLSAS